MYTGKMGIAIILVLLNFVVIASCATEPESGSGLIIAVDSNSASPGSDNIPVKAPVVI